MSTMSMSDVYGWQSPGRRPGNAPPDTQAGSNPELAPIPAQAPAFFLVGIIAVLFVLRFLYEKAGG
jgi:hypothetical protein